MAGNARSVRVMARKWLLAGLGAAVLGATFAAYLHPALRLELANFWALCVAALR